MKKWDVVLQLTIAVLSLSSQELLRFNKVDESSQDYEIVNVSNLTFSDLAGEKLKINKSDGSALIYSLEDILNLTFTADSTGIETHNILSKLGISLLRNYPNPFNPTTTINFSIHDSGLTKVEIYNHAGQFVTMLHNGELTSGNHSMEWDAQNNNTSSGTYFVKVSQNGQVLSSKMLLIK